MTLGIPGVVLFLAGMAAGSEPNTVPPGYQQVWAEEFDGPKLDTSQWAYRTGAAFHSYQRPENISLENGALRIALKKEPFEGQPFTGGGVITREAYQDGYFEVRAKMFGGRGWHESFWATYDADRQRDARQARIEFDCFEQSATPDLHRFTCGVIQWQPPRGSLSLDPVTVEPDLSQDFHTYGFEVAPDYVNFFFDGRLLRTVDMRDLQWCPFRLWLSCIATVPDPQPDGACWFDYLRVYSIAPERYEERKHVFLAQLDEEMGPAKSSGTDLWIQAEDFPATGGWQVECEQLVRCLRGHTSQDAVKSDNDRSATTTINIPEKGTYTLWIRSRDYASGPKGARRFRVALGEQQSAAEFGIHGKDGWEWQRGESFQLDQGPLTLRLIDTGAYYARCDKLLLTTDSAFVPEAVGGRANVEHH